MSIDYEAEYNNRRRVPESGEIVARWLEQAARARASLPGELDIVYGPGARHRYDLFLANGGGKPDTPLIVYIHGGYWQRGDRSEYSFVAEQLAARGADVVLPSYSLCPQVSVAEITDEIRSFLVALWSRFQRRAVVVGHSAGGHLAAEMIATDWSKHPAVPADLVRAGYAISGVFELAPLIPTSLNEALRLTPDSAQAASPLFGRVPSPGSSFVAGVGGAESGEFLRQSRDLAAAWSAAGIEAQSVVVPDANHFTVVDELSRPGSAMIERILQLTQV